MEEVSVVLELNPAWHAIAAGPAERPKGHRPNQVGEPMTDQTRDIVERVARALLYRRAWQLRSYGRREDAYDMLVRSA
jgi:hypothetical protein